MSSKKELFKISPNFDKPNIDCSQSELIEMMGNLRIVEPPLFRPNIHVKARAFPTKNQNATHDFSRDYRESLRQKENRFSKILEENRISGFEEEDEVDPLEHFSTRQNEWQNQGESWSAVVAGNLEEEEEASDGKSDSNEEGIDYPSDGEEEDSGNFPSFSDDD